MRIPFFAILVLVASNSIKAQSDTVTVKDFSNEWMFFDANKKLPLVRKSDFEGNTIHFEVNRTTLEDSYLAIDYPFSYSLFIDGRLHTTAENELLIAVEEQVSAEDNLEITVYSEFMNPYLLKTTGLKIVDTSLDPIEEDVVIVNPRGQSVFKDFYIMSLIILLISFTSLLVYYPRALAEYFRIKRAISPRELDENLLKTKPFTGVNISVYCFVCLLLAQLIISTVYLSNLFPEKEIFYASTWWQYLWNWLALSIFLLTGLGLKYMLLSLFVGLFQLSGFLNSHFYNFLRLSLMLVVVLSVFLAVIYFAIHQYQHHVYNTIYQIILLASIPIILVIYIKLMSAGTYKNLHLFSYLCATELIPFVIILSFGIY